MIHVITGANRHRYEAELLAHFRLRHEIYVVERNWKDLARADGLERDQFDDEHATYILAIDDGQVIGGSRLVPTTRPHLLSEVFPYLASVRGLPIGVDIYEWTRMFVVSSRREGRTMGGATRGMVICGVLEYCLENGVTGLTAVIEMFWLPLFHSMGWSLMPLGLPELINGEWSIAVKMTINDDTLASTRRFHGIAGRVHAAAQAKSVTRVTV
jgi:acyl-homoserine lactone synthase